MRKQLTPEPDHSEDRGDRTSQSLLVSHHGAIESHRLSLVTDDPQPKALARPEGIVLLYGRPFDLNLLTGVIRMPYSKANSISKATSTRKDFIQWITDIGFDAQ